MNIKTFSGHKLYIYFLSCLHLIRGNAHKWYSQKIHNCGRGEQAKKKISFSHKCTFITGWRHFSGGVNAVFKMSATSSLSICISTTKASMCIYVEHYCYYTGTFSNITLAHRLFLCAWVWLWLYYCIHFQILCWYHISIMYCVAFAVFLKCPRKNETDEIHAFSPSYLGSQERNVHLVR